jgi:hypothetical protein
MHDMVCLQKPSDDFNYRCVLGRGAAAGSRRGIRLDDIAPN